MNNDVKDLILAKKAKIYEWLEYLNSGNDDVIWIQKSRAFSTELYNIIYQLQKIESNYFINKQGELINTIGQYINIGDKLKVKEIVYKLKELDDGKEIKDNNLDLMSGNIEDKLEKEKINEQWSKEEKDFDDITNSIINSFKESKINDVIHEELNDNILISKREYEQLKGFKDKALKIKSSDFALLINSGAVLPIFHPDYNNNRVRIEIFDINNHNIEIEGTKYTIKTQILLNKIKSFIDENLNLLIEWSKSETNSFLDNNFYDGKKSSNIKVKYGQLFVNVNGQVSGELGKNIEDFINKIKELIISESNLDDKDYITNSLIQNNQLEKNNNYPVDNDEIVNLLVNKIEKLSDGTKFSIMDLINLNGINSGEVDLIGVSLDTLNKLDQNGIQIKPTVIGITGLPQEITYVKVGKKDNNEV